MYKSGSKCPICGSGKLSEKTVSEEFDYKGQTKIVSDYHVYACNKCKEEIVDPKTLRVTEKVLTDFRRGVDGLLTSDEIKAIRKKLGKTQSEMAEWLGVGEKNFTRYENGQVTQSKTMDLLLRIVGKFPTILNSITAPTNYEMSLVPYIGGPYHMVRANDALYHTEQADEDYPVESANGTYDT